MDEGIPTHGGQRPECPECYHAPHFQLDCTICGCPSGRERKRQRDREASAEHGDSRRPTEGFS